MRGFLGLTKRNLLVFFKDKQTVVFSLLTSIIVLALYLLFLKDNYVDIINSGMSEYDGIKELVGADEINMLANLILLTGIIGSAMITVAFNCLTTLVKDKENRIDYDILATPLKRGKIIFSYFVSAAISSIILTGIILIIGLLVIGADGKIYMDAIDILSAFGIVALGSISSTAFFMIIMLFFKSTSASGAFFGMLSAASGFIIGAYIPISQFSTTMQTVCNIFPGTQVTVMVRNVLMNGLLKHMNTSIAGADNGEIVKTLKDMFGFKARIFDNYLDIPQMILYVVIIIVICILVQILLFSKTYKKR